MNGIRLTSAFSTSFQARWNLPDISQRGVAQLPANRVDPILSDVKATTAQTLPPQNRSGCPNDAGEQLRVAEVVFSEGDLAAPVCATVMCPTATNNKHSSKHTQSNHNEKRDESEPNPGISDHDIGQDCENDDRPYDRPPSESGWRGDTVLSNTSGFMVHLIILPGALATCTRRYDQTRTIGSECWGRTPDNANIGDVALRGVTRTRAGHVPSVSAESVRK